MPGIAGIISPSQSSARGWSARDMIGTMLHEESYTSGTMAEDSLNFAGGWVSHKGSFSDCLPVWNERRDICLLFTGENYSPGSDLQALRAQGHEFSANNASYLVHLYEEKGEEFFGMLNGTFAGCILDLRKQQCFLFNDRYGMGRIYFHQTRDGLLFASEAKALLRVRPELAQLDEKSFGEYFACDCVLQDRTLFKGISLLPGGALWTITPDGRVEKRTYFNAADWEKQPALPVEEYYGKLKETFQEVLPNYFQPGETVSISLTGGLDSRIIMAWLPPGRQFPCYTHRGVFRECEDAKVGRRVAQVCGQPHQLLSVDEGFFPEFPKLARQTVYYTDGAMNVVGAAGLYVNRLARESIAPVRMTGNYGGQVLRKIVALNPAKRFPSFLAPEVSALCRQGVDTLKAEREMSRISFIAFKQMSWLHFARFAMESSQLTIRSPYLDNRLVALAYRSPDDMGTNRKLAARLISDGNPKLVSFPTDRGPLGRSGWFGRVRERAQEFTFRAEYAYDYGMPQWLVRLDSAVAPLHLEKLFLGRHKYYHFRLWYRTVLADFVRETLLDERSLSRSYLDRRRVEEMVQAHTSGRGNYTTEIHSLLTTELMQRELLERRKDHAHH